MMEIVYDQETHDYAMYLDGELVGFARTYHDAEVTLDQLRLEQAQHAAPLLDPALEPLPAPYHYYHLFSSETVAKLDALIASNEAFAGQSCAREKWLTNMIETTISEAEL